MTPGGADPDGENVLVLAPDWNAGFPACRPDLTADARFLVVSYSRPAGSYLNFLEDHGLEPAAVVVIEASPASAPPDRDDVEVLVRPPEKFSLVGMALADRLQEWRSSSAPIVVFFDSVTALMQYTDVDTAYRFLHSFTEEVGAAGARGFYRLAPVAHDESTLATVEQLFDRVLTYDAGLETFEERS